MSLLVDIATSALDPGYAAVAAGRPDGPGARRHPLVTLGSGVLAVTLLVVIAAVQTHRDAPQALRSRTALVDQVGRETRAVNGLQHQLDALRGSTAGLRRQVLASSTAGTALARRLAREELAAGTVAVSGPGLRVVLADAASSGRSNRVLDRDLQAVVNALWAAGAEAVAVDDQRLTTQSAIRAAGAAILVNFEPVAAPYVIRAVGDPVSLETSFASSRAAARMRTLAQLYGLGFTVARVASVSLPAAPGLTLRYAGAVPDVAATATGGAGP